MPVSLLEPRARAGAQRGHGVTEHPPDLLALRHRVVEAIRRERRGEMSLAVLHRLVDEYREGIRARGSIGGRTITVPSRAYLIRALG